MFQSIFSQWLRWIGGVPCCRIYGKARHEADWRVIDLFATPRRSIDGRWPLWRNTCITWSDRVIAVGTDFAEVFLREQAQEPASREHPVEVAGGRLGDRRRRNAAGERALATVSEVMAHECGHTCQARRFGIVYLPLVGAVTLFREGPYFWNHFENQASETGQLGGIVNGSLSMEWAARQQQKR